MDAREAKTRVALLSVASNTILVVGKIAVGIAIGSVSVVSEAIHSAIDLLAAGIALFAVRRSGKPPDRDHPFGHGKIENLSGAVEAMLILVAAVWIVSEAVDKLIHPRAIDAPGLGVGVMLVSAAMNYWISGRLFAVAKETESVALDADGWHLMTDVYTSLGVMLGLILIWAGESIFPGTHFHWIDPVAALVVACMIGWAAVRLTFQAGHDLLDGSLPADEEAWIGAYIRSRMPPIRAFHDLRTRKAGAVRIIEFHMLVDPGMSVEDSHRITGEIKQAIRSRFAEAIVTIHVEPYHPPSS
ncbi:MAG: cation diffusion facilitator family transporter [Candidatus Coatesbacteria bacterium]